MSILSARGFSWRDYFNSVPVEWVEQGPNVARGHINIQCPFCGRGDPSHHMGVREQDGAWGCFRNPEHRGKNPARLIEAVSRCSRDEAVSILQEGVVPVPNSVSDLRKRMEITKSRFTLERMHFPKAFRQLSTSRQGAGKFIRYLKERGFNRPRAMSHEYGLRFAVTGDQKGRVIFPLMMNGHLYGWTGRAVAQATVRYRTHPTGEQVRRLIWNYDRAKRGGSVLFICEGPFDALKLDTLLPRGMHAVALLGMVGGDKVQRIVELSHVYEHIVVLLDRGETANTLRFLRSLSVVRCPVHRGELPQGYKDPGELDEDGIVSLLKSRQLGGVTKFLR